MDDAIVRADGRKNDGARREAGLREVASAVRGMPRTVHLPEVVELAVRPVDALRTDEVDAADFEPVLRAAAAEDEDFGAATLSADAGALRGFSTLAVVPSLPSVDFWVTITSTRRLFS